MEYIKVPLVEADAVATIPAQFAELGLNIDLEADPRDYLNYVVIEDYSYVIKGVYDLKNKNRMFPTSDEENEIWDSILADNPNWDVVTSLPQQDEIAL